jgi:hypothetical protein
MEDKTKKREREEKKESEMKSCGETKKQVKSEIQDNS